MDANDLVVLGLAGAVAYLLLGKKTTAAQQLQQQGAPQSAVQAANVASQAGFSDAQILAAAMQGVAGLENLLKGLFGAPAGGGGGTSGSGGSGSGGGSWTPPDYVSQATSDINWNDSSNWTWDVSAGGTGVGGGSDPGTGTGLDTPTNYDYPSTYDMTGGGSTPEPTYDMTNWSDQGSSGEE
jgi:hypothetical protein